MTDFAMYIEEYLRMRRALGFKLVFPGQILPQFAAYLEAADAPTVTVGLAIAWAGIPEGVRPVSLAHRLGAVRGFAKYLKTIDPATEVPPCGIWRSTSPRPTPYLWSDADVLALLGAAHELEPQLRAATYETLFGLLAVSGMRVGEALRLCRDDIDMVAGVVTIREGKYRRERLVPLTPSSVAALRLYASRRDELTTSGCTTAFFVSTTGTPLRYGPLSVTFRDLTTLIGLRTATVRPRMHDLRHSFAVRTLISWHRSGVVVDGRMPVLSNYLGHVLPSGTYWYLAAAPELMELAAARLQDRRGGPM